MELTEIVSESGVTAGVDDISVDTVTPHPKTQRRVRPVYVESRIEERDRLEYRNRY